MNLATSAPLFRPAMASSFGLIGSKPFFSVVAASLQEWYSQPIFCSIEPALALSAFLLAFSTMSCWVFRLLSLSMLKAPQLVWSAGIGLAATHLALTNWLKSVHASPGAPS